MDTYTEQFFKIQLKWASANFDAEQRATRTRELLMDLAKSLLASELDAVQKQNEDFNRWSIGTRRPNTPSSICWPALCCATSSTP
jgi:hypothetical protein